MASTNRVGRACFASQRRRVHPEYEPGETDHDREATLADLLEILSDEAPGVDIEVEQPLTHLISHMVSGVYAQIAIKIHGDDLGTLQRVAEQVKTTIRDVPGITPPVVEPIREAAELDSNSPFTPQRVQAFSFQLLS